MPNMGDSMRLKAPTENRAVATMVVAAVASDAVGSQ